MYGRSEQNLWLFLDPPCDGGSSTVDVSSDQLQLGHHLLLFCVSHRSRGSVHSVHVSPNHLNLIYLFNLLYPDKTDQDTKILFLNCKSQDLWGKRQSLGIGYLGGRLMHHLLEGAPDHNDYILFFFLLIKKSWFWQQKVEASDPKIYSVTRSRRVPSRVEMLGGFEGTVPSSQTTLIWSWKHWGSDPVQRGRVIVHWNCAATFYIYQHCKCLNVCVDQTD